MKHKLFCFLFGLLMIGSAFAQERRINGKVTEGAGSGFALGGVTVLVQGTRLSTQTNNNGHYEISIPANSKKLEFRFVGFITQVIDIKEENTINATLIPEQNVIGEVIITGYGVQKRTEITGSAARVSGDVIADRPIQSFSQGLTGQASGVSITQPNGWIAQ